MLNKLWKWLWGVSDDTLQWKQVMTDEEFSVAWNDVTHRGQDALKDLPPSKDTKDEIFRIALEARAAWPPIFRMVNDFCNRRCAIADNDEDALEAFWNEVEAYCETLTTKESV